MPHCDRDKATLRALGVLPVYGPNEVTNGDFGTGDFTGWVAGSKWAVVNNTAEFTNLNGVTLDDLLYQDGVFELGETYLVLFDVEASGLIGFQNAAGTVVASGTSGTVRHIFVADVVRLTFKRLQTTSGYIDNIRVYKLLNG